MAKLYFHYSAMNAGKSAQLLQANHNYVSQGMRTFLLSSRIDTRSGCGTIASRIGIEADCYGFRPDENLFEIVHGESGIGSLACVFVDEAQFLTEKQVMELARVVDELGIPVMCYGLRTDFMGRLFTGSEALFRFAEEIREIRAVCWCGRRATLVLRLDSSGNPVMSGESIAVGGNDMYASVCREHWLAGIAHKPN